MAMDRSNEGLARLTAALGNMELNDSVGAAEKNEKPCLHQCVACDAPARLCCTACCDDASSMDIVHEKTWYCGKNCQKQDWERHRVYCRSVSAQIEVRALKRAARILHSLFLSYRHVAYDLSIAACEREGDILHIKEGGYDLTNSLLPGYDAVCLDPPLDADDEKVLMTVMSCTDVLLYLHDSCALFLRGKHSSLILPPVASNKPATNTDLVKDIKEIKLRLRVGPRRWVMLRPWGTETSETYCHQVYQVALKSGSKWALDLAGGQYGYEEVVKPWGEYIRERVSTKEGFQPFGTMLGSWYRREAPADQNGVLKLDITDQAEVSKAITWSCYQISRSLHESIHKALQDEATTTTEFLRTLSEQQYEILANRINIDARKAMAVSKQIALANIVHRPLDTCSFISPSEQATEYAAKVRIDANGKRHWYL